MRIDSFYIFMTEKQEEVVRNVSYDFSKILDILSGRDQLKNLKCFNSTDYSCIVKKYDRNFYIVHFLKYRNGYKPYTETELKLKQIEGNVVEISTILFDSTHNIIYMQFNSEGGKYTAFRKYLNHFFDNNFAIQIEKIFESQELEKIIRNRTITKLQPSIKIDFLKKIPEAKFILPISQFVLDDSNPNANLSSNICISNPNKDGGLPPKIVRDFILSLETEEMEEYIQDVFITYISENSSPETKSLYDLKRSLNFYILKKETNFTMERVANEILDNYKKVDGRTMSITYQERTKLTIPTRDIIEIIDN